MTRAKEETFMLLFNFLDDVLFVRYRESLEYSDTFTSIDRFVASSDYCA